MKKLSQVLRIILYKVTRASLVKRLIAGYIFIILIPTVLLGVFQYKSFYDGMLHEYMRQKQQFFEKAHVNLNLDLVRTGAIYNLIQYNTNIIEYLNGAYTSDSATVYNYLKHIKPLVDYIHIIMPSFNQIKIYKKDMAILSLGSFFVDEDQLNSDIKEDIGLFPGKGMWAFKGLLVDMSKLPTFNYYQKIYDSSFLHELGILEIGLREDVLKRFIKDVSALSMDRNSTFLLVRNYDILYKDGEKSHRIIDSMVKGILEEHGTSGYGNYYNANERIIANTLYINELDMYAIILEDEANALSHMNVKKNIVILYTILGFSLLSTIYFLIAASVSKRLLKLAKHMKDVDDKNLAPYRDRIGNDEIGFLINSYNSMIKRIDDLIYKVHKEEILRKEADYAALQAQIRPHFLYGTLESIRMLAESNNDLEVSDLIFTFGNLIRYSLSSGGNEVFLSDEIDNIRNYLDIQKVRMGERLHYEIDIAIDTDHILCPRFILQPLVENSIIHGIANHREHGIIAINVYQNNEYVIININDNGIGIKQEKLKTITRVLENEVDIKDFQTERNGFGLYNVSERIKMYFGGNSRLVLESEYGLGTICTLFLSRVKGGSDDAYIISR